MLKNIFINLKNETPDTYLAVYDKCIELGANPFETKEVAKFEIWRGLLIDPDGDILHYDPMWLGSYSSQDPPNFMTVEEFMSDSYYGD